MVDAFVFACPVCQAPLEPAATEGLICPVDGRRYRQVEGIWRFLPPERAQFFAQFIQEYETVRRAEGRGSTDPAYYRALPFRDLSGGRPADWQFRARSFDTLVQQVLTPLEQATGRPLRIVDLGAGNGWLSYQLAWRGHHLAAVDLAANAIDGLGAHVYYDAFFTPVQAEFDSLPFAGNQADLVIFNASLHYTPDYETTLREVFRVVNISGRVAVVDTPVYHDAASGAQMVQEREAEYRQRYGFPSNAIAAENYLTYGRLASLAQTLKIEWRFHWPIAPWRWRLRRWRARLRGRREPAQFPIVVGEWGSRGAGERGSRGAREQGTSE